MGNISWVRTHVTFRGSELRVQVHGDAGAAGGGGGADGGDTAAQPGHAGERDAQIVGPLFSGPTSAVLSLYSCGNAQANSHLPGRPDAFLAAGARQIEHVHVYLQCQSNLLRDNGCTKDSLTPLLRQPAGWDSRRDRAEPAAARARGRRGPGRLASPWALASLRRRPAHFIRDSLQKCIENVRRRVEMTLTSTPRLAGRYSGPRARVAERGAAW
jgi:hypothetical protein